MVRFSDKEKKATQYAQDLSEAKAGVIFDYCGLTVAQFSELRSQLFEQKAKVTVVKNTVFKRVLEELGRQELEEYFTGPKAVLFAFDDEIAPIKSLKSFIQKNKIGKMYAGFVDKQLLDESQVKEFADLPTLPELQAKLLGAINSPLSGIVQAISSQQRSLANVLDQYGKMKEQQGA